MQQVSVGYFLADLAMIAWSYPSLGGMEYVSNVLKFKVTFSHFTEHDRVTFSLIMIFYFWEIYAAHVRNLLLNSYNCPNFNQICSDIFDFSSSP